MKKLYGVEISKAFLTFAVSTGSDVSGKKNFQYRLNKNAFQNLTFPPPF
jgi:hypothetical protein